MKEREKKKNGSYKLSLVPWILRRERGENPQPSTLRKGKIPKGRKKNTA